MKKLFFTIILYFFCTNIGAQDVIKTLSDAFKNNSKLNAERASLNATKQDLNISRGEFLPSVTISGNISSQEDTNRINQSGEKLANINSTPENRSVLIEQKIFSGFSNYNNLKKSHSHFYKIRFRNQEFKNFI